MEIPALQVLLVLKVQRDLLDKLEQQALLEQQAHKDLKEIKEIKVQLDLLDRKAQLGL